MSSFQEPQEKGRPPVNSTGRVLIVLSSVAPPIYSASFFHPSSLLSSKKRHSGYYWEEFANPYQVFVDHGFTVDACSETGKATVDEASLDWEKADKKAKEMYENKQHPIHSTLASLLPAADVAPERYDIVYFCGGHAAAYDLPTATKVQTIAAKIYEKGGVVAAVCHGPAILGSLKLSNGEYLVKGKQATGFSKKGEISMKLLDQLREDNIKTVEEYITAAGGTWKEADNPMECFVVTSDRLVTGMNPASAAPVAEAATRTLHQVMGENPKGL